jgi:hypothetical protein
VYCKIFFLILSPNSLAKQSDRSVQSSFTSQYFFAVDLKLRQQLQSRLLICLDTEGGSSILEVES